jgi:hypothetical protein
MLAYRLAFAGETMFPPSTVYRGTPEPGVRR